MTGVQTCALPILPDHLHLPHVLHAAKKAQILEVYSPTLITKGRPGEHLISQNVQLITVNYSCQRVNEATCHAAIAMTLARYCAIGMDFCIPICIYIYTLLRLSITLLHDCIIIYNDIITLLRISRSRSVREMKAVRVRHMQRWTGELRRGCMVISAATSWSSLAWLPPPPSSPRQRGCDQLKL